MLTITQTRTLVIHDFDQWSNPRSSHAAGGSTFSWVTTDTEYTQ